MHNNPTAVAIHECKLLWPDEPIQCVISLGNGRYEPNIELMSSLPSAKKQIDNIIDSATNTESKTLKTEPFIFVLVGLNSCCFGRKRRLIPFIKMN